MHFNIKLLNSNLIRYEFSRIKTHISHVGFFMNDDSEFLIGGDELFFVSRFENHFKFMLNDYIPNIEKPIAIFMSCSKHKPFYKSPYRRVFYSMLNKNLQIRDISQIYTVSEPAIVVPEELDDTNVSQYDFPPDQLKEKGREVFIERLTKILPKIIKAHKVSFYVLPRHHRGIFEKALEKILEQHSEDKILKEKIAVNVKYLPPLTYNIPKAKEGIKQYLENFKIHG